jgi:hypothetical protein
MVLHRMLLLQAKELDLMRALLLIYNGTVMI